MRLSEENKYIFSVKFTVKGDSTRDSIKTLLLQKLRELKVSDKILEGWVDIVQIPPVEPYRNREEL